LEGTEFEGSQVAKVCEVEADVDGGLDGVLVEVKLELLHRCERGWADAWAKIKNCLLIIHLLIIYVLFCLQ
jgi:hypothetical protein